MQDLHPNIIAKKCSVYTIKTPVYTIQVLLSRFSNKTIVVDNIVATTGLWQNGVSNECLLMNTICSITRFHIWKVRCKIRYGQEVVDFNSNVGLLTSRLRNHMNNLLSSHSDDTDLVNDVNRLIDLINNLNFWNCPCIHYHNNI